MLCVILTLIGATTNDAALTPIDGELCGLHAVAVVAHFLGNNASWDELTMRLEPQDAPFSVDALSKAAQSFGFDAYAVRWKMRSEAEFECPAILLIKHSDASRGPDHFVACLGRNGDELCVVDFPGKPKMVPIRKVMKYWEGAAIYIDHPNGSVIPPMRRRHRMINAAQVVLVLIGSVALLLFVRAVRRQAKRQQATA